MNRKLNQKSKSAHTPTPYRIEAERDIYGNDKDDSMVARMNGCPQYVANAAFIVRACNSHEKLLEACKQAIMSLNSILNGEEEAMNNAIIDVKDIEAAIAEAEK